MEKLASSRVWRWALVGIVGVAAILIWRAAQPSATPEGFARSNGRIEAVELDVAAKTAGRIEEILVNEGDFVTAGQILARMDTASLDAQLREAQAELTRARIGVDTARSQVAQAEAEHAAAVAVVEQREAELDIAAKTLARSEDLAPKGVAAISKLDQDRAAHLGAKAALSAAKAQVASADAAIGLARSGVVSAEAAVEAVSATIERIETEIDDSTLRATRDGRVQYRVAQPGEVVAAGGKVLNVVDLSDVYMSIFLPTAEAGRLRIGAEARIVLDAAPAYVIPAEVSYVADVAQFTPKSVETAEERQKLMFRVKAKITPELLRKYITVVKTGVPGVTYVRIDPSAEWPEALEVTLPEEGAEA